MRLWRLRDKAVKNFDISLCNICKKICKKLQKPTKISEKDEIELLREISVKMSDSLLLNFNR